MSISDHPHLQPDNVAYGKYTASLKAAEEYSLGWFAVVDVKPKPESGPVPCLGIGDSKIAAIADAFSIARKVIGNISVSG